MYPKTAPALRPILTHLRAWNRMRRRADDDDSPLPWRLATAAALSIVALAAAGSLLA